MVLTLVSSSAIIVGMRGMGKTVAGGAILLTLNACSGGQAILDNICSSGEIGNLACNETIGSRNSKLADRSVGAYEP